MLTSEQVNMNTLYGWLIILAQSAVFLGIFFRLIVLTSNHSYWYTIHDHDSSWQSLHNFVQFFQLGLVSFFLLIPEADLDRLTLRWTFLSMAFLLIMSRLSYLALIAADRLNGQFSSKDGGSIPVPYTDGARLVVDLNHILSPPPDYKLGLFDSETTFLLVQMKNVPSSAFGPGSPARQGAGYE